MQPPAQPPGSPPASPPASWLREASGGLIAGAVAVVYAVSYAALLFPGPLKDLLPVGIGLCLLSATLGAFWLAWRSELPFAVGGPDGNTTSILAAMAASVGGASLAGAGRLEHVLLLLASTTLLCALLFLVLGFGRLGAWVRYVPYPVVGGFLASTGWLIATGALRVVTDMPLGMDALPHLVQHLGEPRLLVTLALAAVFLVVFRRGQHPGVLPLVLLASGLLVMGGLAVAGMSHEAARSAGWLFDAGSRVAWSPPWHWLGEGPFDWYWLAGQWLNMLAVAAVAVITVLLGATGLEVMSRRDISLDHELRTHGWLNLLTILTGGYLSLVSVSRSAVLLETGATRRGAGMVAAGVCAVAAAGAALLLGWVPRVVLGAFLLYLGLSILSEWLIQARQRLNLADRTLILVILAITATVGFTVAVFAGILASCLSFALNYSRIGVVQHDLDGTSLHSSVVRPAIHRQQLARHGQNIRVLVLRGMVFFGTSITVLERLRAFIAPAPGARTLVLDFTHVAGADSSAAMTFVKIAQLAAAGGVRLHLCGMNAQTRDAMASAGVLQAAQVHATLDHALDAAEESLLSALGHDPAASPEPLAAWLLRELGDDTHCARVLPLLERVALAPGQALLNQGQPTNSTLYLIETGRVAITLAGQNNGQRLASLMGGNIVGEMALYSSANRSATVTAERDTVAWALTSASLERLQVAAPDTAMQLHSLVMRTLAERVRTANGTIAALQRGT
ncbi:MAG: SLC26A/SulP transporter family protein [Ramlibacter sp.]|nr:SLC26A/SulP transporter family protein [Ramlibacter sp.]